MYDRKTNLFPNLIRFRETNRLKMAIAASIMLWCATPQQAAADTYEKHEIASVQQQKVKNDRYGSGPERRSMIGVSVKVKDNATMGAITDLEGKFSIDTPKGATLEISYIGYKTVTVKAEGTALHITMKEDAEVLDEVVIVGYGSQKKVNVTGAVGMVNSEVLEARPVQNVSQALQGVVPGLNLSVGNSGGALDSSMSINIRGAGTIGDGSGSSPLILIDGIEGDLNSVNPNDIENVSVLKDAASASIYGARAAFGVILVTTRVVRAAKQKSAITVTYVSPMQFRFRNGGFLYLRTILQPCQHKRWRRLVFDEAALERIKNYQTGKYTDPNTPEYYGAKAGNDGKWQNYTGSFANTDWFKEFYKKLGTLNRAQSEYQRRYRQTHLYDQWQFS